MRMFSFQSIYLFSHCIELPEEFSPLTYIVPGQLFATALHRIVGRRPFIPPYTEERMEEINYRQIWQGGILEA